MDNLFSFDTMEPEDGFVAYTCAFGDVSTSVHVGLMVDGKLLYTWLPEHTIAPEMWRINEVSIQAIGKRNRAHLLSQAICRFLNQGGELAEAVEIVRSFQAAGCTGLQFPGYELVDAFCDNEGSQTAVFVKEDMSGVVRWIENELIDQLTPFDARIALHDSVSRSTVNQVDVPFLLTLFEASFQEPTRRFDVLQLSDPDDLPEAGNAQRHRDTDDREADS